MTTNLTTFEEYLKEVHAKEYRGLDDDMPDAFEHWLCNLQVDDLVEYAEKALHQQREMIRKGVEEDYIEWLLAGSYGRKYKGETPFGHWKNKAEAEEMKHWT